MVLLQEEYSPEEHQEEEDQSGQYLHWIL